MSFEFHQLTDTFAVAPQLQPDDIQAAAAAGFKSVIINRPDFELEPSQPTSDIMMAAAQQAGMQVRYQPVVSGSITMENVQEFKQLLAELPTPILAYCRSGTRCANLFQYAQQN